MGARAKGLCSLHYSRLKNTGSVGPAKSTRRGPRPCPRTGVFTHNGVPITVREGDRYLRDDSIVAAFPWMFDPDVERATATPGEKRTTRARRKPAP